MRNIIIILFLSVYSSCSKAQFDQSTTIPYKSYQSDAQRVTDKYCNLVSATISERLAIRKAVSSLEGNSLYGKIFSINIWKYYTNGRCPNILIPLLYNGAFCDSITSGVLGTNSSGVVVGNADTISTYWINDLSSSAPEDGFFWYVGSSVEKQIISSTSPFNIFPRDASTTAYTNIWANSPGVAVPAPTSGFNFAQRYDGTTVQTWQGVTKYTATSSVGSANPRNNICKIIGNSSSDFTLKISGFTQQLTDAEVITLKTILDTLASDLGI